MEKLFRFVGWLFFATVVSSPLLTIEWFTWGAWLFVSLVIVWTIYINHVRTQNQIKLWKVLADKLDEISGQLDNVSTRLSTKDKHHKKYKCKSGEQK